MAITNLGNLSDRNSLSGHLANANPGDRVNFTLTTASAFNAGVTAQFAPD